MKHPTAPSESPIVPFRRNLLEEDVHGGAFSSDEILVQ